MAFANSKRIYEYAKSFVTRGVQTNFKYVPPHPIYFSRAEGSRIWDVDGNEYIDCVLNFGPMILGHRHPKVVQAVKDQLETGLTVGLPTEQDIEVCKKLVDIVPSAETARLGNTGTEAMMHALKIARAYTGRNKLIKVEGGYNGHCDDLLVSHSPPLWLAGPAASPSAVPDSGGLRKGVTDDTIVIPFNNLEVAERVIKENKKDVAALIIEPVQFNLGCVLPHEGYLQGMREITQKNDIVLVFDEVRSGFRPAPGGAQEYYKCSPDLTVVAKAIANGFPLSALLGKKDLMDLTDPVTGRVLYAGTYNANMTAVAAASATLEELRKGDVQKYLNQSGEKLASSFHEMAKDSGVEATMQTLGGYFQIYFAEQAPTDYRTAITADKTKFLKLQSAMLREGIYCWPNHLFPHGISAAHDSEDLKKILRSMEIGLSVVVR